jgi:hypothetical protein
VSKPFDPIELLVMYAEAAKELRRLKGRRRIAARCEKMCRLHCEVIEQALDDIGITLVIQQQQPKE